MSEELEVIDHTTQELSKFDAIEAAIAEIKTQADAITVADHTDKANATKARNLRLTIKPQRIQADKLRKELKADGLKFLDMVEKKAQTVIKPLAAIEADLQTKEDIVSKHAEREAEKERQRIAAEQEAARKQLEADQARLAADRAELERQRAEIEKEKADAEAKRQHEADIAAAVELGKQRERLEQAQRANREHEQMAEIAARADFEAKPATVGLVNKDESVSAASFRLMQARQDAGRLTIFAVVLRDLLPPLMATPEGRVAVSDATAKLTHIARDLERAAAQFTAELS